VKIKIYKTIILPVVLYGCETLSLTLREENKLRVFENSVLRRIFGPNRDEVTGGWRKLHGLYSSPSIIRVIKARRMRWVVHVACMGEVRGAYNILVGKPEGRRPLERPRRKWEDNIRMDLGKMGFGDVDWIHLAQDWDRWRALVNSDEPSGFIKFGVFLEWLSVLLASQEGLYSMELVSYIMNTDICIQPCNFYSLLTL
jgi:hypothetical protein